MASDSTEYDRWNMSWFLVGALCIVSITSFVAMVWIQGDSLHDLGLLLFDLNTIVDQRFAAVKQDFSDLADSTYVSEADEDNSVSHLSALPQWCDAKGGDWAKGRDGQFHCFVPTQEACETLSNNHTIVEPKNLQGGPELFWDPGYKQCFQNKFGLGRMVCDRANLPYLPPTVTCSKEDLGACDFLDLFTCELEKDYCDKMGTDYTSDPNGEGDCYVPDWQKYAEMVVGGKTFVRQWKKAVKKTIKDCRDHGAFSEGCWSQIGRDLTVNGTIVMDTLDKYYRDNIANFKTKCTKGAVKDTTDAIGCADAIGDFFPGYYFGKYAVRVVNGLLGSIIPGWNNVSQKAWDAISKYGPRALDAIARFGTVMAEAIYKIGENVLDTLDRILPTPLTDAVGDILEAAGTVGTQVFQEARIIANCAIHAGPEAFQGLRDLAHGNVKGGVKEIVQVAAILGKAAWKVSQAFAEDLSQDLQGGLDNLANALDRVSSIFPVAAPLFADSLRGAAEAINGVEEGISYVGQAFEQVADAFTHTPVVKDVEKGAEEAWDAITSIF